MSFGSGSKISQAQNALFILTDEWRWNLVSTILWPGGIMLMCCIWQASGAHDFYDVVLLLAGLSAFCVGCIIRSAIRSFDGKVSWFWLAFLHAVFGSIAAASARLWGVPLLAASCFAVLDSLKSLSDSRAFAPVLVPGSVTSTRKRLELVQPCHQPVWSRIKSLPFMFVSVSFKDVLLCMFLAQCVSLCSLSWHWYLGSMSSAQVTVLFMMAFAFEVQAQAIFAVLRHGFYIHPKLLLTAFQQSSLAPERQLATALIHADHPEKVRHAFFQSVAQATLELSRRFTDVCQRFKSTASDPRHGDKAWEPGELESDISKLIPLVSCSLSAVGLFIQDIEADRNFQQLLARQLMILCYNCMIVAKECRYHVDQLLMWEIRRAMVQSCPQHEHVLQASVSPDVYKHCLPKFRASAIQRVRG